MPIKIQDNATDTVQRNKEYVCRIARVMGCVSQIAPQHTGGAWRVAMANRKNIDWEGIEEEYRMGQKSIRTIADEYGTYHLKIQRKAKDQEWVRDKSEEVRQRTRAALIESEKRAKNRARKRAIPTKDDLEGAVQTIFPCRGRLAILPPSVPSWVESLLAQLAAVSKAKPKDAKPVRTHAGIVKDLAIAVQKFIPLERQAFNLDATSGDDDAPTRIIIEKY